MRIAFDHQAFCRQIAGGISRYYSKLAVELSHLNQQVGIFAPIYRNIYLKELPTQLVHGFGIKNYPPKSAGVSVAANGLVARSMIRRWQPDVVHETYFQRHGETANKFPHVVTVFDMIAELDAQQQSKQPIDFKRTVKYQAVQRADHVICISEHTRQDLVRLFDVSANKLSVIHLGCDQPLPEQYAAEVQRKIPRPFLLYVGLREGYKNFARMVNAIAASPILMKNFDIIAFGGGEFTLSEKQLISSLGFDPRQVRQLGGTDQDLNSLYRQAAAFIYPSTYEGFGLPPLEAMAMLCPVVSSNASSMPEVIGDAAEFFDPDDTDSMRLAIEQVVLSEERKQDLIKKGNQRVAQFRWSTCAEKTLGVYQAVVKKN